MTVGHLRRASTGRAIGRFLSLLAVLLPVLLGPAVHAAMMRADGGMDMPGMDMSAMDTAGGASPCGMDMGGAQPDQPSGPAKHHPDPDCAICPLCAALAHPAIAWTPVAFVPLPRVVAIPRPEIPLGARAPPVADLRVAYPRGPPASI